MSERIATRDAYGKVLLEMGAKYPDLVVLDADLAGSTRTEWFGAKYPDRFYDIGIAEQDMVNIGAGFAASGKRVVCSSFAIFGSRAWEQIRNTAARAHLPMVFAYTHAGLSVGADGASAQANEDVAVFRAIPDMKVVVPADATETRKAVPWILEHLDGPVYMRFSRAPVPVTFGDDYEFELGRGVVVRKGSDVAIIACGQMVALSLDAADELAKKGIRARVVNMASIKPIDGKMVVKAAKECGAVVTVEEHSIIGGLGSAVCEVLSERHPTPVVRVGVKDVFGESGTPDELFDKYGLSKPHIVKAAKEAVGKAK
ncbi:MAG TPA: transketolase C-terminal domain-containing protein [Planctomycetota bacterium]|nr:transketolase C-terminal domain-containing protein [Planctomycetota bacterium]